MTHDALIHIRLHYPDNALQCILTWEKNKNADSVNTTAWIRSSFVFCTTQWMQGHTTSHLEIFKALRHSVFSSDPSTPVLIEPNADLDLRSKVNKKLSGVKSPSLQSIGLSTSTNGRHLWTIKGPEGGKIIQQRRGFFASLWLVPYATGSLCSMPVRLGWLHYTGCSLHYHNAAWCHQRTPRAAAALSAGPNQKCSRFLPSTPAKSWSIKSQD